MLFQKFSPEPPDQLPMLEASEIVVKVVQMVEIACMCYFKIWNSMCYFKKFRIFCLLFMDKRLLRVFNTLDTSLPITGPITRHFRGWFKAESTWTGLKWPCWAIWIEMAQQGHFNWKIFEFFFWLNQFSWSSWSFTYAWSLWNTSRNALKWVFRP